MLIPSINLYCIYSRLDLLGGPVFRRNYLVSNREVCLKKTFLDGYTVHFEEGIIYQYCMWK